MKGGIDSIHPYPAKFIREIPRTLIQILGVPQGTSILDPFCGSGATLVEAQLAGITSIGIDLNPIACLISRVKTQPLDANLIEWAQHVIHKAKLSVTPNIPLIPNLDHWFMPQVQEIIARLLNQIAEVSFIAVREALQLALSSILVRISNQESDTRYAAIAKKIEHEKIYQLFLEASHRIALAKDKHQIVKFQTRIICQDVLKVTKADIQSQVGLVITSPPYPNAYEYWLYHKYRMFWLGYDPLGVKEQEIGARAHYFKKDYPTEQDFRNQMTMVLQLIQATLIQGGYACIVIGRSKIHGRIIDNSAILGEVAHELGFTLVVNLVRRIANSRRTFNLSHANIKTENILVFAKE